MKGVRGVAWRGAVRLANGRQRTPRGVVLRPRRVRQTERHTTVSVATTTRTPTRTSPRRDAGGRAKGRRRGRGRGHRGPPAEGEEGLDSNLGRCFSKRFYGRLIALGFRDGTLPDTGRSVCVCPYLCAWKRVVGPKRRI